MNIKRHIIKISILLMLLIPSSLAAQVYQISGSDLYCANGEFGPKLYVVNGGNTTEVTFNTGLAFYINALAKTTKQLKSTKSKLKKSPNDSKLKKKKKKLTTDSKFYVNLITGIQSCSALLPIVSSYSSNAVPISTYYQYEGASIYASDGEYLGIFSTNRYYYESIANTYGLYGSPYQYKSVFNDFGPYGSQFSTKSARNSFCINPPILYINGRAVAYLTSNQFKTPRIDPDEFLYAVGRTN